MAKRHLHATALVLLLGVVLAFVAPDAGLALKPYAPWLLMSVMLFSLVGVRLSHMLHIPARELVFAFCTHYLLIPIVTWLVVLALVQNPNHALGILLATVMPMGITAPTLVRLMGGNFEDSLAFTVFFFLSSILISPLLLWLLAGIYVPIQPLDLLKPMALFILLPLAVAVLLDRILERRRKAYDAFKRSSSSISLLLLLPIIWGVTSGDASSILEDPYAAGRLLIIVAGLFMLVFIVTLECASFITRRCPDELALTMLVYKSYVLAAVLAAQLFSAETAFAVVVFAIGQNLATAAWIAIVERYGCSVFTPKYLKIRHSLQRKCAAKA